MLASKNRGELPRPPTVVYSLQWAQMVKAVAAAEEALGPVDVLIPNAGIASSGMSSGTATSDKATHLLQRESMQSCSAFADQ